MEKNFLVFIVCLTTLCYRFIDCFVADIEVHCYDYEGIDAVKNALRAGLNLSTEDMPIKVNSLCPLKTSQLCNIVL